VLGRFKPGERGAIEEAVAKAAAAAMIWVRKGLPACMNAMNGAEKPPKPKKPRPAKDETKSPPTTSGGTEMVAPPPA